MGPLELEERVAQSHRRGVARTGGQTWRGKPADTTRGNEARQAVGFWAQPTGGVAGRLGCGRHRARESGESADRHHEATHRPAPDELR